MASFFNVGLNLNPFSTRVGQKIGNNESCITPTDVIFILITKPRLVYAHLVSFIYNQILIKFFMSIVHIYANGI